jgi:hypothetical protein
MFHLSRALSAVIPLLFAVAAFGQSDRGTITGTVVDVSKAAIAGVAVSAQNTATGVQYPGTTTETGTFTLPSLPMGEYSLSAEHPGFKKFTQSPIRIDVAQTVRVDVTLQLGNASESITVSAEASLLQQDSSEYSMSMSGDRMNDLPLNFAVGPGAIRSPYGFIELMPGASNSTVDVQQSGGWGIDIKVNGMPNNSFKVLVDGQDATNPYRAQLGEESQPSNEAVAGFALQSSNYAAEFGRAGGGVVNFTTKSGSNQYHGSVYDHIRNEVFGAGLPYTNDGAGHLVRGRDRQQDFGFSLGGPIWIPKLYNGKNKTFFFVNYEMFRKIEQRYSGLIGNPTESFRNGDFSAMMTGRSLVTDNIQRPVLEGVIYDINTDRTVNNNPVRDPFPGNVLPKSRLDPVALAIQNLIPKPQIANPQPINNYWAYVPTRKIMSIPSVKLDQMIGNARISFYFSHQRVDKDNSPDGWPYPISVQRYQEISSNTSRLNYDHSLTPSLFNHFGIGMFWYRNPDQEIGKDYDSKQLGLQGILNLGFPTFSINNISPTGNLRMGTGMNIFTSAKPTVTESLTLIRRNHTFKFGGEWAMESGTRYSYQGGVGNYTFASAATGYPVSYNLSGGYIGNGYASFLLGLVNNATMGPLGGVGYRRQVWAGFAQDTWKVTRKLTLDYGLRYDLETPQREVHNRTASFDPNVANPTVGGLLGGIKYEGYGPGRCNCSFIKTYPYEIGPRIGLAWQVVKKTVIRAGLGISYGRGANEQANSAYSAGFGFNTLSYNNPGAGKPAFMLKDGIPYNVNDLFANTQTPGLRPLNPAAAPASLDLPWVDPNAGRAPRIVQWNLTIQREISKDLVLQAAYVGNRASRLQNDSMTDLNANSPERLAAFGLNVDNAADRSLLTSQIGSATAIARGFKAPYVGFPSNSTVSQSLRPFPQFGTITTLWSPVGNSYYDSLQVNLVKRWSHGVDASLAYTWSKNLTNTYDEQGTSIFINDPFNRANHKSFSPFDQPKVVAFGFGYQFPSFGIEKKNRWLGGAIKGWSLRGVFRYASGIPIPVPTAQSNMNAYMWRNTTANRVAGEPLFLQDLNGRNFDPNKQLVLNPKAWVDPATGHYGDSSPYFNDYRYQRRPKESASLAKTVKFKERYRLDFRAEFFNIFNRTVTPNPVGSNAKLTTLYNPLNGALSQGFGRIDPNQAQVGTPRSGQIVLRLNF